MAELYPWSGSPRLWRGTPKTKYKAAIVASRLPEVRQAVKATAEAAAEIARARLQTKGGSKHWSDTGISGLHIEVSRGKFTDYHVNLVAYGRPGMSEEDVLSALYSLENGRRSYTNKNGQRIPAFQGMRVLGGLGD